MSDDTRARRVADVLKEALLKEETVLPPGYVRAGDRVVPSVALAEDAAVVLLQWAGGDPGNSSQKDTASRVVRALKEMTQGTNDDPAEILSRTFDDPHDDLIILSGVSFTSLCEHHMLPFVGTVDLGYLPGKVVGLSKLARLVDCFSRRLQIQERMTREIADALETHLDAKGVACVVRASHSCMACRGVRKPGATMVTSSMLGLFRTDPSLRSEFLSLCR
jgi:GTP cyclohydrolase I